MDFQGRIRNGVYVKHFHEKALVNYFTGKVSIVHSKINSGEIARAEKYEQNLQVILNKV